MTKPKKAGQQVEPDNGEPGSSADQKGASASNPDKLEELSNLVKSLVHSQTSRDEQRAKDSIREEQIEKYAASVSDDTIASACVAR